MALIVLVVGFAAWLGFSALSAKSNLEKARDSAQQVKDALLKGESQQATQAADKALSQAQHAQAATRSLPWNLLAAVPVVGSPFKTGQQISDVVVGLAGDLLRPAANAGIGLTPSKLYQNGRVDVQLLRQQEPQLVRLSDDAQRIDAEAADISQPAYLSPIIKAREQLQKQTSELSNLLRNSSLAAQLGPSMMGVDGPRSYLMAFQTNAEARGTGGLLGGFGILEFENGRPSVDTLAPNTELNFVSAEVDLGPEFKKLYGWAAPFSDFRNTNLSAHFPYAAQIWKAMWERQARAKVDGVIGMDPVALSYVLGAIGPVSVPGGDVVTKENVVELTESTAYIRFPTDQVARKKYLQDIANAVVQKMTGQIQSPRELLEALGRAISERRIMLWSAFPEEQKVLEQTPLGHVIPDDPAPYAQVVINNLAGNKMDYYLKREIEYAADGCDGDMRNSTVTVRLKNTADGNKLPEYVSGTMGLAPDVQALLKSQNAPDGTMVTSVRLIATQGAKLLNVTSNGERTFASTQVERGHSLFEVQVVIPPGQSGELVFQLSEPTSPGEPRFPVQPLIDSVTPVLSVAQCPA